jgi:cell division protein FtsN
MNDKTKLYLFSKKEIAILFTFIVLAAVVSFIMGIKIGKNFSFESAGFTSSEQKQISLKSTLEESTAELLEEQDSAPPETKEEVIQDSYQRLKNKIDQELKSTQKNIIEKTVVPPVVEKVPQKEVKKESVVGKYTIQLGSHRNLVDAENFSEGFRIRGYNPVINEVTINGRGTWYRVSLGAFDNIRDLKDYVEKEKSLFESQDYVVGKYE